MSFRKVLFWIHLLAGVISGLVIAVMCFTGVVLAFEQEIVVWSERDARQIAPPTADATPLPADELLARARAARPDTPPTSLVLSSDRTTAAMVAFGRDAVVHVDPYTGEVRTPASTAVHDFMHVMEDWHRWIALSGDQRPLGKAITGACNTAFLVLGLSGLYLWWPRHLSWRTLKPSLWFVGAQGKARDWNWHNVIGFWSLPVLIVLTASGMVISYRWVSNLVYTLAGEQAPTQQGPAAFAAAPVSVPAPAPGARRASYADLVSSVGQTVPGWQTISFRLGGGPGRGGGAPGSGASAAGAGRGGAGREAGAGGGVAGRGAGGPPSGEARGPQAVAVTVRTHDSWPAFASTTLSLDPFTAAVLRRDGFADLSAGRQARMWLRFLHTGQAFGWIGQLVAGLASLGGCVLVYTGVALSYRRFFRKRTPASPTP